MLWMFLNTSEEKKDPTIQYLSGYSPSFGFLVYDPDSQKKCIFVAEFEVGNYTGIKNFAYTEKNLKSIIMNYFGIKKLPIIGVNYSFFSLREASIFKKILKVKITDISKLAAKLRMIKSNNELKIMGKASHLTDVLFTDIVRNAKLKKFQKESDIYNYILKWVLNNKLENSFNPIVATGKNAASPHHDADESRLLGFTVLDFGVKYKGYCSDMSRTLYFGTPNKSDIKLYDDLLKLQLDCIKAVKPDVKGSYVDGIARSKLGKNFVHILGHGVGVQIHEAPHIGPKGKTKLENGMVITIEPGYYKRGRNPLGIRIEDTLAILNGKPVLFNKSEKKLISIGK